MANSSYEAFSKFALVTGQKRTAQGGAPVSLGHQRDDGGHVVDQTFADNGQSLAIDLDLRAVLGNPLGRGK